MTLLPVGRLEGRVVSEQPELLRNMSITIKTDPQSGEQCTGTATVTPDADGRFVIPRIAAGWVEVEAALADPRFRVRPRFIGRRQLEVAPGKTTRLDIPLETARKVAGVVRVKGTHEPVVGARLAIRFGDVAQWDQVATDSQGRYSAVVLHGQVSMQVIYAGRPDLTQLSDSRMATFPVPDGTSEFELPAVDLVKTKSVSGRLLDHEGKPLRKYRITGLVGNNRVGWGESNESGNFTLGSVPEDVQLERYQIHTEASPIPKDTTVVTRDPLVIRLK
jgi:hypothetical protein